MKLPWDKLGQHGGAVVCLAGLALVWFGWNGAASYDDVPAQFPYLVSGGIGGLCLVVIGVGLSRNRRQRADQAELQAALADIRQVLGRLTLILSLSSSSSSSSSSSAVDSPAGTPMVTAGPSTFHRTDCTLVQGRSGLPVMALAAARSAGLEPCRTCDAASL